MPPRKPPTADSSQCAPIPGEAEFLARFVGEIEARARGVYNTHRLGMTHEDVAQEITFAVLMAVRKYYHEHGVLPPDPLVHAIITRRKLTYVRNTLARYRIDQGQDPMRHGPDGELHPVAAGVEIPDPEPSPEAQAREAKLRDVRAGLVYAIRRNLTPAAFSLLHLRFVEEQDPDQIARLVGDHDDQAALRTSRRISVAKVLAMEFLRQLGIANSDQVEMLSMEDFDAAELD